MTKTCVITGGCGFIGSFLVRKMVQEGWNVRVVDNMLRGDSSRIADLSNDIELFDCDIRHVNSLNKAFHKADVVFHLAAVNGTENFYQHPELVLDVGLRGMLAVTDACYQSNVTNLVVASSAEVYQTPENVPTNEQVSLTLPNSLNPRYSYGGSKIVSELIAFNYKRDFFEKIQVFRPHNVYGPNMGFKHVIPQFILRALECKKSNHLSFPIQGTGDETRAFAYVNDVVDGIYTMYQKGAHREIYHIGNDEEVSIKDLVRLIGKALDIHLEIECTDTLEGSTHRRCPDILKMQHLSYNPKINLKRGLTLTLPWYEQNLSRDVVNQLI
jgi:UDP-glucose 4-epimerase